MCILHYRTTTTQGSVVRKTLPQPLTASMDKPQYGMSSSSTFAIVRSAEAR